MKKIGCCSLLFAIAIGPGQLFAQETMEFTLNSWMSEGQTKWRHDASALDAHFGVPSSELDYQGVNSQVTELGLTMQLPAGHALRFSLGSGAIEEGTLVDDDYLSASGATYYGATQSGAHRFSRTHSDIDGNGLSYFSATFMPHDLHIVKSSSEIRFGLGFQHWEEEYTANGIRQIECTVLSYPGFNCAPAGTVAYTGVTVITNKVEWSGVGLTMDGLFSLTDSLSAKLDATYYPVMRLVNEDIHHLRSDLAQDPSVRMTGTGTGYDLAASLRYRFSGNLLVHLGYRVWERSVKNQTITFYGASGGSSSADLMDFNTRRDGLVLGLDFYFK